MNPRIMDLYQKVLLGAAAGKNKTPPAYPRPAKAAATYRRQQETIRLLEFSGRNSHKNDFLPIMLL